MEIKYYMVPGALLALLMIWFPEDINDLTLGSFGEGGAINKPTPTFLISGFGWVYLLGLLVFFMS